MLFENLSEKLQNTFSRLRGKGKLSEKDVDQALREVRLALLEADVNYKVVKDFVKKVKARAIGEEVMESLNPGQMVIKIVNDELTMLMGEKEEKLRFSSKSPSVILMCGLQGAGKTTHVAKLAKMLKKQGRRPLLVACDVYRPAAIKQLQVVGAQVEAEVFSMGTNMKPEDIARVGVSHAMKNNFDTVLIDTAGRLHVDAEMMDEIKRIKEVTEPTEILLVVDAMTGQDAVNVAEQFNQALDITGIILTKLDGDARGGAALSIRAVTEKPIKFVGMGEKLDQLESFYPERMASRILGMGDVLSLIEKAQSTIDEKQAKELEERIRSQNYSFNDFLVQLEQMRNMGPMEDLLAMIPGVDSKALKDINIGEKDIKKIEAMIQSMTQLEREDPSIIDSSRKKRIVSGSGSDIVSLNKLLKQFKDTKKMMKKMNAMEKNMKRKGKFGMPFFK